MSLKVPAMEHLSLVIVGDNRGIIHYALTLRVFRVAGAGTRKIYLN